LFQSIDGNVAYFDGYNAMIHPEEIGEFAIIGQVHQNNVAPPAGAIICAIFLRSSMDAPYFFRRNCLAGGVNITEKMCVPNALSHSFAGLKAKQLPFAARQAL
jgi:hypothetical protein